MPVLLLQITGQWAIDFPIVIIMAFQSDSWSSYSQSTALPIFIPLPITSLAVSQLSSTVYSIDQHAL